ncbi:FACT complex subunit Spt16p/Cdc68p [Corchorus capsularis]|uniref:FACT complex subunit n=1 Tax=Corchorus capsularis TaxID=210143 RepID=A0A1R3K7J9_COCAP|nr:FACT complex subunit Spt16p/Cdc68p [Corchorus capsularis]
MDFKSSSKGRIAKEQTRLIDFAQQQGVALKIEQDTRGARELIGNFHVPPTIGFSDLWILPPLGVKEGETQGTLEVHENGFRYSTIRSDKRVDITFGNIKHAILQTA